MSSVPESFKGIALFTPAGDLVYCIDPTKQGRWHAQLCSALQGALNLPELPHFLTPCYTATVDRWWDPASATWQVSAELSPNVYRYRALLDQIFDLEPGQWQLASISPGVCDPLLLYRYQEIFPTLWQSHNLAIALESSQPIVVPPAQPLTQGYGLRLFVAGYNQKTENILEKLHQILEASLDQPYTLSVIDITKYPEAAETHQILATPTLLKLYPLPEKRLVGKFGYAESFAVAVGELRIYDKVMGFPNLAGVDMVAVAEILDRAVAGEDLMPDQALLLLQQQAPAAIAAIRQVADQLRQRQVGDTVTYVVNRNINFTNICEQHCSFCAFRRDEGDEGAYWLGFEQILAKAAGAVAIGATEICMQGGLNLQAKVRGSSLAYYQQLVRTIKEAFPALHVHAFSPQEVQFIGREDGLSYAAVIAGLGAAGVGSMPGTAAEVLDDQIRRVICPEKLNAATWVEIVGEVHRSGIPTTSTILSGHIETAQQQIAHLEQLRQLQQRAVARGDRGITEFIILPFVGQDAPKPLRNRVGRDQPVLADALLLTAVARIYLGNWIKNHQPSWVKLGLDGAVEALRWGCNDIGGTLMEEHITSMAGAIGGTMQTVESLQGAIARADRPWRERDTLYTVI